MVETFIGSSNYTQNKIEIVRQSRTESLQTMDSTTENTTTRFIMQVILSFVRKF